MQIYFGTIVRTAPVEQGGSLFRLDWDSKTIVKETPVVPSEPAMKDDPNARGNMRGCKGIQIVGDDIIAADYHTLNFFDRDLKLKRKLSGDLMIGLHETQVVDSAIWVTSTTVDAALKYDLQSGELLDQYWPREMPEFQKELNIEPLEIDKNIDNRQTFLNNASFRGPSHLHLNAVCEFQGEVYALFHSKGVVANLSQRKIVIQDDNLQHAHNLIIEEPGVVLINDTHRTVVRQYDLASGKQTREYNIKKMPGIKSLLWRTALRALKETGLSFLSKHSKATARPLYLRGLAATETDIFAGFSPATIARIDRKSGKLIDYYFHSNDARVCIHGLAVASD
jgi:hypothetical protein